MASLVQYFAVLYGIYWSFTLVGVLVVRSGTRIGRWLEAYTWNSRIRAWHALPPFRVLFDALHDKKYLTSSLLVMLFNLPMVATQYALGMALISPILAAVAGGLVGVMVGQGRQRSFYLYSSVTLVFEFGAFALAGALGMMIGESWLLLGNGFVDSVTTVMNYTWPFSLLPLVCLATNGLVEAAGVCFWDIDGVPGIEAYRNWVLK